MYSYSQVEGALARVHNVSPNALGAFRGRINNLKRLGVTPSAGGRGKKISYDEFDVLKLAFCLQLTEFGIDPATISQMVFSINSFVIDAAKQSENSAEDIYIVILPSILTAQIHESTPGADPTGVGAMSLMVRKESEVSAKAIREEATPKIMFPGGDRILKFAAKRIAAINVSELVRDIDEALKMEVPKVAAGVN